MKKLLCLSITGLLLLGALTGCGNQGGDKKTAEAPAKGDAVTGENPSAPTPPGGPGGATETPSLPISSVPASLRHAGFEYYGLANDKPIDMELVTSTMGSFTGSQTLRLKSVEGDKAVFQLERTGGLAQLGSMELSLEPTGVYVTSSTMGKLDAKHMEVPAKLAPGIQWTADSKITRPDGGSVENKATFRVIGERSVKTKAGDRTALLIESTGPGTQNGQKVRMDTKMWLAKGIGLVRMEVKVTPEGGSPITMTLQETP